MFSLTLCHISGDKLLRLFKGSQHFMWFNYKSRDAGSKAKTICFVELAEGLHVN